MDGVTMQTPLDGEVSVPFSQIPVLLYRDKEEAQEVAARAVNFLRCGCKAVQVMISHPSAMASDNREEMHSRLSDAVRALSILPCDDEPVIKWSQIYKVKLASNFSGQFGYLNFVFLVFQSSDYKQND